MQIQLMNQPSIQQLKSTEPAWNEVIKLRLQLIYRNELINFD